MGQLAKRVLGLRVGNSGFPGRGFRMQGSDLQSPTPWNPVGLFAGGGGGGRRFLFP